MAGCFGNDPEDRYYEDQLLNYLEKYDYELECYKCGEYSDDLEETIFGDFICKECAEEE